MIRFINLTNQIDEGEVNFAFYCTVRDRFLEFDGCQVFDDLGDFLECYLRDESENKVDVQRLINLMGLSVPIVVALPSNQNVKGKKAPSDRPPLEIPSINFFEFENEMLNKPYQYRNTFFTDDTEE